MEKSIVDFSKLSEDILEEYDIQKYDSFEKVFEDIYLSDDSFSVYDAVELLKDNSMQEVVEMQPYIYKCDGKYYRWPDEWLEDDLIEQYPFARVSEKDDIDLVSENEPVKHKIYGFSEVYSEGFCFDEAQYTGKESRTQLFGSLQECVDAAYESYCEAWSEFEENGLIVKGCDEIGEFKLERSGFENAMLNSYVVIQLPDSHVQFEYFEQELELQKEVEMDVPEKYQVEQEVSVSVNNTLSVSTPLGDIVVTAKTDSEYPGVYVDLKGEKVNDTFEVNTAMLATIEFEPFKGVVQSIVYGNAECDEPSRIVEHENLEKAEIQGLDTIISNAEAKKSEIKPREENKKIEHEI